MCGDYMSVVDLRVVGGYCRICGHDMFVVDLWQWPQATPHPTPRAVRNCFSIEFTINSTCCNDKSELEQ